MGRPGRIYCFCFCVFAGVVGSLYGLVSSDDAVTTLDYIVYVFFGLNAFEIVLRMFVYGYERFFWFSSCATPFCMFDIITNCNNINFCLLFMFCLLPPVTRRAELAYKIKYQRNLLDASDLSEIRHFEKLSDRFAYWAKTGKSKPHEIKNRTDSTASTTSTVDPEMELQPVTALKQEDSVSTSKSNINFTPQTRSPSVPENDELEISQIQDGKKQKTI